MSSSLLSWNFSWDMGSFSTSRKNWFVIVHTIYLSDNSKRRQIISFWKMVSNLTVTNNHIYTAALYLRKTMFYPSVLYKYVHPLPQICHFCLTLPHPMYHIMSSFWIPPSPNMDDVIYEQPLFVKQKLQTKPKSSIFCMKSSQQPHTRRTKTCMMQGLILILSFFYRNWEVLWRGSSTCVKSILIKLDQISLS